MPDAIVLPIIFGMKRWELHSNLLRFFVKKSDFIIGRNPMGAKVGLNYFDSVIYDGRSALKGEIKEYDMALNGSLNQSFLNAEEYVVNNAKYRTAVSSELLNFWKKDFSYSGNEHLVLPCSLAYSHEKPLPKRESNQKVRLLFSGGGSPWQSQKEKYNWIRNLLNSRNDIEFVFLTKSDDHLDQLLEDFPERVKRKWLKPEAVFDELAKADYGILLREDNLTNRVSAPVKYAEYLNAGLSVIISSSVKDYAQFTIEHKCGIVLKELDSDLELKALNQVDRDRNRDLAQNFFSKNSDYIQEKYKRVLNFINE